MKTFVLFAFSILLLSMSITLITVSVILMSEVYENFIKKNKKE